MHQTVNFNGRNGDSSTVAVFIDIAIWPEMSFITKRNSFSFKRAQPAKMRRKQWPSWILKASKPRSLGKIFHIAEGQRPTSWERRRIDISGPSSTLLHYSSNIPFGTHIYFSCWWFWIEKSKKSGAKPINNYMNGLLTRSIMLIVKWTKWSINSVVRFIFLEVNFYNLGALNDSWWFTNLDWIEISTQFDILDYQTMVIGCNSSISIPKSRGWCTHTRRSILTHEAWFPISRKRSPCLVRKPWELASSLPLHIRRMKGHLVSTNCLFSLASQSF